MTHPVIVRPRPANADEISKSLACQHNLSYSVILPSGHELQMCIQGHLCGVQSVRDMPRLTEMNLPKINGLYI